MSSIESSSIFISYRRDGGSDVARILQAFLEGQGYDVFLDVDTLGSGHFDEQLLAEIRARRHFLIICSSGSLDRCTNEEDWVRRELAEALRCSRNIIPIVVPGFSWTSLKDVSAEVAALQSHNAFEYSHGHWRLIRARLVELIEHANKRARETETGPAATGTDVEIDLRTAAAGPTGVERDAPMPPARVAAPERGLVPAEADARSLDRSTDTVEATGQGQSVTRRMHLQAGLHVFRLEHAEPGHFSAWLLDETGKRLELLANVSVPYDGSKAVRIARDGDYLVDISARGSWRVSVGPVDRDAARRSFGAPMHAATCAFELAPGLAMFRMTHQGAGHFGVWLLDAEGRKKELLANAGGEPFQGTKAVSVAGGRFVLDVSASGPWTIDLDAP